MLVNDLRTASSMMPDCVCLVLWSRFQFWIRSESWTGGLGWRSIWHWLRFPWFMVGVCFQRYDRILCSKAWPESVLKNLTGFRFQTYDRICFQRNDWILFPKIRVPPHVDSPAPPSGAKTESIYSWSISTAIVFIIIVTCIMIRISIQMPVFNLVLIAFYFLESCSFVRLRVFCLNVSFQMCVYSHFCFRVCVLKFAFMFWSACMFISTLLFEIV